MQVEAFYRTHRYLVEHVQSPVRRLLMDEIDWSHRLIGIKGSRGVGKTTFLLQYARDTFGADDRRCLYVNFNNFYFTEHTLVEFAGRFYADGGRTLLIDQTFKYENWSAELRQCYDRFPELHIVFSGSTVMRLIEGNDDLKDIVAVYNLRGFSFREFVNLQAGKDFPAYTLDELMERGGEIAAHICREVNPADYFGDYLHHGYYPFFLERRNFSENLLKTMNMMLEVDILLIKQIELKYLTKLKQLLYAVAKGNGNINISRLSGEVGVSRATILNYLHYMKNARLLTLLFDRESDDENGLKPNLVYMHNPNLLCAVCLDDVDGMMVRKTFFVSQLCPVAKLHYSEGEDFLVDGTYDVSVRAEGDRGRIKGGTVVMGDMVERGRKNVVPLWLAGFVY